MSDPIADLRRDGAAALELCARFLAEHGLDRPIAPETVDEMRTRVLGPTGMPRPVPEAPTPLRVVMDDIATQIAPAMFSSWHPRSFSYFTPPPMIASIVGDLFAAVANQSADTWQSAPGAALIEDEVVRWLCELAGYPAGSGGVLTSGGVMANLTGLAVMRDVRLPELVGDDRAASDGIALARVYASDQAHFSVRRALGLLGFRPECLVVLRSDERFRLDPELVHASVVRDRVRGHIPLGIAAVAGSTNTGSVDPVEPLASIAREHGMWLHVDAAYGGGAWCAPRLRPRLGPLDLADSITVDPHKWMFQTIDLGGLLVRRRVELRQTFDHDPEYYETNQPEAEPIEWFRYGIEGTRRFRALKLWTSWRHAGTAGFGSMVERTVELADALAGLVQDAPDFELALEPELSVVCFRHRPEGFAPAGLDAHQVAVQRALEVSGEAWVSTTRLRGEVWLRAGVMNPATTTADLERLLDALRQVARLGRRRKTPIRSVRAGSRDEEGGHA